MAKITNIRKPKPFRRQRPYPGGRLFAVAGLIPEIEVALQSEMDRYHVTRSFVIANALAYVFRIEEQEHYDTVQDSGKLKRTRRRAA